MCFHACFHATGAELRPRDRLYGLQNLKHLSFVLLQEKFADSYSR